MSQVRTFIAIQTSPGIADQASRLIKRLQAANVKVNWVERDNLHWTLKFLGDVDLTATVDVCRQTALAAAACEPFELSAIGAGAFPSIERPRTLWIGAGTGSEEMAALADELDRRLVEQGYPPESRRFKPHLTIGRVRSSRGIEELAELLAAETEFQAGTMSVDELTIFSSHLERQGPVYEPLGHADLGSREQPS